VTDPAVARSRVEHVADGQRVMLWVRATRIADVPIFEKTPQQSDYHDQWWQRPREGQPALASSAHGANEPVPPPAGPAKPNKFLAAPDPRRQAWKRTLDALSPSFLNWLRSRKRRRRNMKFAFETQSRLYKPVDD
jgi:hypothetical protein